MRAGFHEGELLVQHRAGVAEQASRLSGMLTAPSLGPAITTFVAHRDLVFLTTRDRHGTLWTSVLHGPPGFVAVDGMTLHVRASRAQVDLLGVVTPGSPVGTLMVDFARRRRVRVNGVVAGLEPDGIAIAIDQAYGNCPRYIHRRELHPDEHDDGPGWARRQTSALDTEHIEQIRAADTFVLGTAHPSHGVDTSHRGGAPGFVRVEPDGSLWWPDHPGNNLFNSLGNIAADPEASLLFVGPPAGRVLQIAGRAVVEWVRPGSEGDDGGTGRRVHVWPEQVVTTDGRRWRCGGDEVG